MLTRIAQHQADRPSDWLTVETPLELAAVLAEFNQSPCCILVDCLTLWTLNVLETQQLALQTEALFAQLERMSVPLILVSNEIGLGVMPMGKLTRDFVDALGRLHQRLAQRADGVTLMVAGLPMTLKPIKP
jgi:adenosylcobinamide kinase/adenosylcobinamide-phosphate guanylyltransferase